MFLLDKLKERAYHACEICSDQNELNAFAISPKDDTDIDHIVLLCGTCKNAIETNQFSDSNHWRSLSGSIWSESAPVQALSYRLLNILKEQDWASEILEGVTLDEHIINWALSEERAESEKVIHKDAFGNILQSGDNVVLIDNLKVKGTNYFAPKGTQVRKIKLISNNAEQIEGKINQDTIVILTKFIKKG